MPKQGDVHVIYYAADKGWRVEVTGEKRASATHSSKWLAARQGRKLAKRNRSELVVHDQDGKIGTRRSFGSALSPLPGTRVEAHPRAEMKTENHWRSLSVRDRQAVLEMLDQDESTSARELDERAERIRELTGESS